MARAQTAFQYYGSKARLAPWIIAQMTPHIAYVEPFAGSAAVLIAKEPVKYEVINDLDGDVVNFFRVLRDNADELIAALALTPYARDEFAIACQRADGLSDVERARRFMARVTMAFNGRSNGSGAGYSATAVGSQDKAPCFSKRVDETLGRIARRLRHVEIENVDALRLIDRHDRSDVTIYCDPPYTRVARQSGGKYAMETTGTLHKELLRRLDEFHGEVVLSGYDSEDYAQLGPHWIVERTSKRTSTGNGSRRDKDKMRTEVLWIKRRDGGR